MSCDIAPVEIYVTSQQRAIQLLRSAGEISYASDLESMLAKSAIIASASLFEVHLKDSVSSFIKKNSSSAAVFEFSHRMGVARSFHTWFDWKSSNANQFYKLFGENASNKIIADLKNDIMLEDAARSFMFIGSQRNLIVHGDLLSFSVAETTDGVMKRVRQAQVFVDFVSDVFLA